MSIGNRLWLWLFTTDSNKRLPDGEPLGNIKGMVKFFSPLVAVWIVDKYGEIHGIQARLSTCHEPPCWIDAQGNAFETKDTRWSEL